MQYILLEKKTKNLSFKAMFKKCRYRTKFNKEQHIEKQNVVISRTFFKSYFLYWFDKFSKNSSRSFLEDAKNPCLYKTIRYRTIQYKIVKNNFWIFERKLTLNYKLTFACFHC